MRPFTHPEALESRIAPAVFFLSGSTNEVSTADPENAGQFIDANSATDAMAVSATIAVKLTKGDSVVLDLNNNHVVDPGETFAKVTGGKAILFASNVDATNGFTANEITGLAVSDGFNGTITGTVNGSIATNLDATGALTRDVLQDVSIKGLTVTQRVTGSIFAGKNISNVTIGADPMATTALSVTTIASGTQADSQGAISFNGGGTTFDPVFTFAKEGEAGGSITNVKLFHGASKVFAGDGNSSTTGKGGAGGGITKLTFEDINAATYTIDAGNGGNSTAPRGKGGNGGIVAKLSITSSGDSSGTSRVNGGDGGNGNIGGNGGALTSGTFNYTGNVHYIYCNAGAGGDGVADSAIGQGGNGGTTTGMTFISTSGEVDFWGVYGGEGGDAGNNTNGKGGSGGKISKITYEALGGSYSPYVGGGDGGDGKGDGAGGAGGGRRRTSRSVQAT